MSIAEIAACIQVAAASDCERELRIPAACPRHQPPEPRMLEGTCLNACLPPVETPGGCFGFTNLLCHVVGFYEF